MKIPLLRSESPGMLEKREDLAIPPSQPAWYDFSNEVKEYLHNSPSVF
ncbi:MAG: hypothetical protein K9H64_15805 [Bacteroidales bacterium]|nr:hypothetical protein [Bacteroidales bacterium]MCF8457433.1 hypothetical protein [Bacteroidales bacterium]